MPCNTDQEHGRLSKSDKDNNKEDIVMNRLIKLLPASCAALGLMAGAASVQANEQVNVLHNQQD